MRKYYEMHKSMEYKQTSDYYEARRHICRASARLPTSQSTAPHFPSSLDGMRN